MIHESPHANDNILHPISSALWRKALIEIRAIERPEMAQAFSGMLAAAKSIYKAATSKADTPEDREGKFQNAEVLVRQKLLELPLSESTLENILEELRGKSGPQTAE